MNYPEHKGIRFYILVGPYHPMFCVYIVSWYLSLASDPSWHCSLIFCTPSLMPPLASVDSSASLSQFTARSIPSPLHFAPSFLRPPPWLLFSRSVLPLFSCAGFGLYTPLTPPIILLRDLHLSVTSIWDSPPFVLLWWPAFLIEDLLSQYSTSSRLLSTVFWSEL